MSASQRAAELRALADQHDELGVLEDAHTDALAAYRAEMTEANKDAYQQASRELREARADIRSSGVMVSDNSPGSVTIGGAGVGGITVGKAN